MPSGDNKCEHCGQWAGDGHVCATGNGEASTVTLHAPGQEHAGHDSSTRWDTGKGGVDALRDHSHTMTNLVADGIANLDDGSHHLVLNGHGYVLYVDTRQARSDDGRPVEGMSVDGYGLIRSEGGVLKNDFAHSATSAPFRDDDGRQSPQSRYARAEIAEALVDDVLGRGSEHCGGCGQFVGVDHDCQKAAADDSPVEMPPRARGRQVDPDRHSFTPWGPAQSAEQMTDGVVDVRTASHGGFHLSPEMAARLPPAARSRANEMSGSTHWYEEDFEQYAVVARFGHTWSEPQPWVDHARQAYLDGAGIDIPPYGSDDLSGQLVQPTGAVSPEGAQDWADLKLIADNADLGDGFDAADLRAIKARMGSGHGHDQHVASRVRKAAVRVREVNSVHEHDQRRREVLNRHAMSHVRDAAALAGDD